ncbi:MAG: hypothetical protein ACWGPR_12660, partial [Candidatus Deferrimicrobiaceae bacterium]
VRKVHISVPRIRRAVRFLSRFGKFPLSPDMLDVLVSGNTGDDGPYTSAFGLTPLRLSEYIDSVWRTDNSTGESASAGEADSGPRKGGDSRSREAA